MLPLVRTLLLLLLTAGVLPAASLEETYGPLGRLIVTSFTSAPFPHPARTNGHTYQGKSFPAAEHYSDSSVAIFIPKGYRPTERVDLVIHFHGWHNSVGGTLATFELIEQFVTAQRNAVLVVPEGPRNAPDSFGGKLEDVEGFKRFIAELMTALQQRAGFSKAISPGRLILSGHSGGYRVMAAILDRGGVTTNVKEVWLFDGLYAEADKFLTWTERQLGRLLNIYTDGGGTKDDSEAMMELLRQRATPFLAIEEAALTNEHLRTNQFVFIHTELGHNDVLAKRGQFTRFLETSTLERLPP